MRMLLTASFDTFTSRGNDAVDMAIQFGKLGVDVVPWPEAIMPGLPKMFTDLLTKDASGMFDLSVMHGPPQEIQPWKFAPVGRAAVGWTYCDDFPLLQRDMAGYGWESEDDRKRWWGNDGEQSDVQRHKNWLDLMVVTHRDAMTALGARDPYVPYATCPTGIDPDLYPEIRRPLDSQMVFGCMDRSYTPTLLAAWALAQAMEPQFDAKLILKGDPQSVSGEIVDRHHNITLVDGPLGPMAVQKLYEEMNVMVTPSWGEETARHALPFMATAGAVIAPLWGANREWLHPDTGYPLNGEVVTLNDGHVSFMVDVAEMAETFVHCWRKRSDVRRKGELAGRTVRAQLSWEAVCKRFLRLSTEVM